MTSTVQELWICSFWPHFCRITNLEVDVSMCNRFSRSHDVFQTCNYILWQDTAITDEWRGNPDTLTLKLSKKIYVVLTKCQIEIKYLSAYFHLFFSQKIQGYLTPSNNLMLENVFKGKNPGNLCLLQDLAKDYIIYWTQSSLTSANPLTNAPN